MFQISDKHHVFVATDYSGMVIFFKNDYSTIFIQADLSDFADIMDTSGNLKFENFMGYDQTDSQVMTVKAKLIELDVLVVIK
jgi:hypothetical protein